MTLLRHLRPWGVVVALTALAGGISSCQRTGAGAGAGPAGFDNTRIFGNGFKDASPVLAKVGDIEITRNDFDRRFAELPEKMKKQYTGEGWEKRFLRFMTDEALLYQEAQKRNLARDPEIGQILISSQRYILVNALRERALAKEAQPTEQDLRNYYDRNRDSFKVMGTLQARHIQCRDRQTAWEAYRAIKSASNPAFEFPRQVGKVSVNVESAKQAGELGYFNKGGFIPAIPYAARFSEAIWDYPIGLHEPVEINGDWHVVEIERREPDRTLTFEQAHDQVVNALLPMAKQRHVDDFLRQARRTAGITYFGEYAPGGGVNPRDLIRLAQLAPTPEEKLAILTQVMDDYPESEYVDDAMFLTANLYLDAWADIPFASSYLDDLLREHPDSEYADQARYLLENMGKPNFGKPTRPEDLQRTGG
ncbi:MAG: peptidyl-prolyl cis-trans isomerase [Candidatus Krumholzibacteriia bacterium]